ncbi:hypothetical protein ACIQWR_37575 [Streptomyces sp. NPDC098789]|uniref:hypothetical protein n=1 Tax=Streptomyces sp. NPDC098789 TaxID=3366098 RepID=UPI0037FEFDCB
MYGWLWRRLPGPPWTRAPSAAVLVAVVVLLLFRYVFPWVEPLLPPGGGAVDGMP